MTISKSAVLSGLMKIRTMPPSFGNSRCWDTAAGACCAGACACAAVADSKPAINPRAITPTRRATTGTSHRTIAASCVRKGATLTYSRLHKNRHCLVGEEDPLAGQPPRAVGDFQQPALNVPIEVGAKTGPGIDPITVIDCSNIRAFREPEGREECVAQAFVGGHPSRLDHRQAAG